MPPKRKGAVSTATHWEDLAWHPHVCLEYTTDAQTRTVDLLGGAAYIGRNSHLRLAFCEPVVSQTHALVEFDSKKRQWKIRDMGSSHGTAVNGKTVSAKRATFLKNGDQIMLSEEIEMSVKVVHPDEDCTVMSMLQRHAAVKEDIARYDLETMVVEAVDGWETCRDRMAEVLGEEEEDEEDEEADE